MEEKYKGKIRIGTLVCIFLFVASTLPLNTGMHQTASAAQHQSLNQQAAISLYIFEKNTTRRYRLELSVDDATEMMNLIVKYLEVRDTAFSPRVMDRWQHELFSTLHRHWILPDEAMQAVLSVFSTSIPPREHVLRSQFFQGLLPLYEKKEKIVRASITSSGAGVLIPMALAPRPRLTTFWKVESGKTLAIDWVTKYGYNATGPHLGVAVGFIGVGFSSRLPNEHRYVLVGGALVAVVYGDTITPIVPS